MNSRQTRFVAGIIGEISITRTWAFVVCLFALAICAPEMRAQTYKDIYEFDGTTHGCCPRYPDLLAQGRDGNLYGTTAAGGIENNGVVFKMTPEGKVTLLHNFCSPNCKNGDVPTSGLVQGSDGNFYGDTFGGGILPYAGSTYQITPTGAFTAFHLFCSDSCLDGSEAGALMQATDGNFYGTTLSGGAGGDGTVFRLSTGLGPFVAARPGFGSAGQAVTILGNGLSGTTSVTFNGLAATFKAESDTFIRATVPSGATSGPIVVTTPSGTLNSNVAFEISR